MSKTIYPIPHGLDVFDEHELRKMNRLNRLLPIQEKMIEAYQNTSFSIPIENDIVEATYITESKECFLLDAGYKDYIHVPKKSYEIEYFKSLSIGDKILVHIVDFKETPFYVEGSISSLKEINAKNYLNSLDKNEPIMAYVKGSTPAGYTMEVEIQGMKIDAFMPNTLADVNKLVDPLSIVGKNMEVLIESFSEDEGNYIVNRKAYLNTLIPGKIMSLEREKVYTGFVTGTTSFGVFVQFEDYLTGMIHKSNIHPDWANRLEEIPCGTEIDFYFKYVIKDERRGDKIILTQILTQTLWDDIEDGIFKVGDTRKAYFIKMIEHGALFSLDVDTIGLATVNDQLKNTLVKGNMKTVRVMSIDKDTRKITLEIV